MPNFPTDAREADALVQIQKFIGTNKNIFAIARGLSHFGEHALGWFGMSTLGILLDKKRRVSWLRLGIAALISHAASVVIKRIVRRNRPSDSRIHVGVATPSKLSFPSSHSTSTAASLVYLAKLTRSPLPLVGIPVMMISRMILGVHYPTDVLVGALVGTVTAEAVARIGKENV
ncbi:putative integral membrane protein [Corynebacterium kutscheri]|uniref:phosphatase PAP2 family protein n=1 Tax=Corynebacterium kutscheri TaxID=35755 RepID=UPI000F6D1EEE|nr:phosphatase PAP2 family protein [Corynebacterium kutscheri]VEH81806.1 putative integral membrane protein [Corynebacterium kutscheri]